MKIVHGSSGEPEDPAGSNANSGCSPAARGADETVRLAAVHRGERRRRSLELKLAKEKVQKHLESLTLKKKERDDEVYNNNNVS